MSISGVGSTGSNSVYLFQLSCNVVFNHIIPPSMSEGGGDGEGLIPGFFYS